MAVVRITASLISDVATKIKALYMGRITAAAEFPDVNTWGPKLVELAFGSYAADMAALPSWFFNTDNEFSIRGWYNGIHGAPDAALDFPLPTTVRYPAGTGELPTCGLRTDGYRTFMLNADDARWDEFKTAYVNWTDMRRAINIELDAAVSKAKMLLGSYATLAPALKEWPALWDLLSEDVKDTHRLVRERKPRAAKKDGGTPKPDETPDMTELTAMIARNKIMNGGQV